MVRSDNPQTNTLEALMSYTSTPAVPLTASNGRITAEDLERLKSKAGLRALLKAKKIDIGRTVKLLKYEEELEKLQIELVKLQRSVQEERRRVAILFEGRDAAGKGGAILRFTQHLSPRAMRIVALPKPTDKEKGEWYFQRYTAHLPAPGEIVFFDRSWYNRAVVEPVNGFCTEQEYQAFMRQAPEFELMLHEDGVEIVKFWFAISKREQKKRFEERHGDPRKNWKISPIDQRAQELWDSYTHYKEEMFSRTHTSACPWIVVRANNKKKARLESIRYVLSTLDYDGKDQAKVDLHPDPNVAERFHRGAKSLD
jgi:polyphosphate kinase 2